MDYITNVVVRKYTNGCIYRTYNWNLQSIIRDYSEKSKGYIIQKITRETKLSEESKSTLDISRQDYNTVYFESWRVEKGELKMPDIKDPPQYDDKWLTAFNEIEPVFHSVSYKTSMLNTYKHRFGTKGSTKQRGEVAWISIEDRGLYEKATNELKEDIVLNAGALMANYSITFENDLNFIFSSVVENNWDLISESEFYTKVRGFINDNRECIQFDKIENDGSLAYDLIRRIWNEG